MLSGAWAEIENDPPEEGADDGLLEGGDNTGMDGGVHDPILYGIEAFGEGIVAPREAHVARYRIRCLVRLSGW